MREVAAPIPGFCVRIVAQARAAAAPLRVRAVQPWNAAYTVMAMGLEHLRREYTPEKAEFVFAASLSERVAVKMFYMYRTVMYHGTVLTVVVSETCVRRREMGLSSERGRTHLIDI